MNRPRALSVPSTLDGFDHAPQRVGREPPLDQPHERLTRPGQWVGRTGKREYLVGHRVVRVIPLHREALLTPLHVAG
jgi:hypothetical protein